MMRNSYIILSLLMVLFTSCELLRNKPGTTVIQNVEISIPFQLDTISGLVNINAESPQITFYGTIKTLYPEKLVSGAIIRVVGTDTPGGNTMSREDGFWTITLPIVPKQNDENLTWFAIEIQKKGAVMAPISDYCKDTVVWELLDVKNPDSYMTAGVYGRSLPWGNLYAKIENHLYITMED